MTIADDDLIDTTITGGPVGPTNDSTPTFTFTADPAEGATFECAVDAAPFAACATPFTPAAQPDGEHTLRVRAVTPGGDRDTTPATRAFTVDTVAPTTGIILTPQGPDAQTVTAGVFTGTVRATVELRDPPPGVANGVTRCVLDPPLPPATYDDLPVGQCPDPTTAALGSHVLYAASLDQALNVGPVATAAFTILAAPDTTIVSGPGATTWQRDPPFSFAATIPGSSFQCSVDGAAYTPCTANWRPSPLAQGSRSVRVRAISPAGAPDPTPASRAFTVARAETHDDACRVSPFAAPAGSSRLGCGWGSGCANRVACGAPLPTCPVTAVCTLTMRADFKTPLDRFLLTNLGQVVERFGTWKVQAWVGYARPERCTLALLNGETSTCAVTAERTFLGRGVPVRATYCAAAATNSNGAPFSLGPGDAGPDDQRSLSCDARVRITAASALEATAAGTHLELYAPAPGTIGVIGDISPTTRGAVIARRVEGVQAAAQERQAGRAGGVHPQADQGGQASPQAPARAQGPAGHDLQAGVGQDGQAHPHGDAEHAGQRAQAGAGPAEGLLPQAPQDAAAQGVPPRALTLRRRTPPARGADRRARGRSRPRSPAPPCRSAARGG